MARREFRLPDLGEGLAEAEIVQWLVTAGDRVTVNQPLVEVETAKAVVELPSPFAGLLVATHGAAGDTISVGTVLVTVEDDETAEPAAAAGAPPAAGARTGGAPEPSPGAAAAVPAPAGAAGGGGREPMLVGYGPRAAAVGGPAGLSRTRRRHHRVAAANGAQAAITAPAGSRAAATPPGDPHEGGPTLAKPPVRRLARDLGVDLGGLVGTGPAGTISRHDVEAAAGVLGHPGPPADARFTPSAPARPAGPSAAPAVPPAGAPGWGPRTVPPAGTPRPDSAARPDVNARPTGVTRPGGVTRPDGAARPDGLGWPDGTAQAGAGARLDGTALAAGPAAPQPGGQPAEPVGWVPAGATFDEVSRTWRIRVSGVRRATARAMVSSAFTAPHVTEFVSVDLTETLAVRDRIATLPEFAGLKVTPLLFVARALVAAVRRHPMINAGWVESGVGDPEIVVSSAVNLGIAVASPRGLLVPNVPDADRLDLAGLAQALHDLTTRTRSGRARPADLSGGTITITNIGVFGVDIGTPILNPGEAAILAIGAIRPAPWVHEGQLAVRTVGQLALSFDHRLVDGELGSAVLADIAAMLTDPTLLLAWS
ncbi:dihydrolipoamide acetyltransferase family protein [Pseudofrankia inefficax]|uniref:Dihydrolipoamide acetyltransferase component of pyruvate dehydrogenase complex n=1 Tax=Pseudofrankia inefficax (strain DSM 45817 / CECT 9037 / DDB 130130 / EuI1c) TaxID=298654 RepID=E3IYL9_PSEI1|nr:dihydrolipoamide acetyltransferase family protein [Pseudofrankia inefficax]ADP85090.1 catalytic domain-containing protein of components of various dehydrogenase complexes [Pseudofrankia inefficax]